MIAPFRSPAAHHAPAPMSVERHRWVVDSIEEQVAACEVDGDKVVRVPRWILPPDAREGSVLSVRHEREGVTSRLLIDVDGEATRQAYDRSREQLAKAPKGGKGDIAL